MPTVEVPVVRDERQFVRRERPCPLRPVHGQGFPQSPGGGPVPHDRQPERVVLSLRHVRHRLRPDHPAVVHGGQGADVVMDQHRAVVHVLRRPHHTSVRDEVGGLARVQSVHLVVGGEREGRPGRRGEGELLLQLGREPHVVAVEKCDVVTPGPRDGQVPGAGRAPLPGRCLRQDPLVLPGQLFQQIHRVVRGRVVGDQQFEVGVGLRQHRPNCGPERGRRIVYRHHHRNQGHSSAPYPDWSRHCCLWPRLRGTSARRARRRGGLSATPGARISAGTAASAWGTCSWCDATSAPGSCRCGAGARPLAARRRRPR
ncbi:hypothetical protein EES37_34070 [Streptomyces sp. ADI91-18]|nr:hypothetical protein EES37_34070 [Streptomyces sp. ADI91-18]